MSMDVSIPVSSRVTGAHQVRYSSSGKECPEEVSSSPGTVESLPIEDLVTPSEPVPVTDAASLKEASAKGPAVSSSAKNIRWSNAPAVITLFDEPVLVTAGGRESDGILPRMLDREEHFIEKYADTSDLSSRYRDRRTDAAYVNMQLEAFAAERGISPLVSPALKGMPFNEVTSEMIKRMMQEDINRLFLNKDRGTFNSYKHRLVSDETARFIDLLLQARNEGDVSSHLDAARVMMLVRTNVCGLAWQDRAATELIFGDHGIRHIVAHNIKVGESLFDELENKGCPVRAIDRLTVHQIMIFHDLGYAVEPSIERLREEDTSVDRGHNLFGAKYFRQRGTDPEDPLAGIFSTEQVDILHQGALQHDDTAMKLILNGGSAESRKNNILSAVHVADNSHVFSDKLPELLYQIPESLEFLRLLKTASEIGDERTADMLKAKLVDCINGKTKLSVDDKLVLGQAVQRITPDNYRFSINRICATRPQISIDDSGSPEISAHQTPIHRDIVNIFGIKPLGQLQKFTADLTGMSKDSVNLSKSGEFSGNGVHLAVDPEVGRTRCAYEIKTVLPLRRPRFQAYVASDNELAARQASCEKAIEMLRKGDPSEAQLLISRLREADDNRSSEEVLLNHLSLLKNERRKLLSLYMERI